MTRIETYKHKYKDPSTYNRDLERFRKSLQKKMDEYQKYGGNKKAIKHLFEQIDIPTLGTLKEDIYNRRERIEKDFIEIGVSPTRANKIAIEITQKLYKDLKKPSKNG